MLEKWLTPVANVGLINIYLIQKYLLLPDESAQNGIIFQNVLTLVADVQKLQILYQNDHLYHG